MTRADLYRPAGSLAEGPWSTALSPEAAGWRFTGLRVAELGAGEALRFETGSFEVVLLPLAGGFEVVVEVGPDGTGTWQLDGRASVWAGPTDFLYVPPGSAITVTAAGDGGGRGGGPGRGDGDRPSPARLAVPMARAEGGFPVRHVAADEVAAEVRGRGAASREVRNFAAADRFAADRLIAVEVVTPGGNWSSYPPHKHDEVRDGETELEEIYHYVVADGPDGPGLAYQHVYGTPDRPLELLTTVHTGDTVLIPHGWHGPAMAAPGYDLYYLNVMAGPGERAWRASDDPAHAWVRDGWADQAPDPRLPLTRRD